MTHGELFSGCGGLTLGLERATGARLAWHCQHDPESRKQPCDEILKRHWPGVPNLGDITAVDWGSVEPVDLLAGGFPCQDVSHAGLRAGLADGTRSGLWFQFAAAIRVLRPAVVVVENVPGLLTAGFGVVMADLAEAGYHARWACLRAADVGAPHGRERVFVVATDADREPVRAGERCAARAPGEGAGEGQERERVRADDSERGGPAADSRGERSHRSGGQGGQGGQGGRRSIAERPADTAPDTGSDGREGRPVDGRPLAAATSRDPAPPNTDSGRRESVGQPESRRLEGARGRLADGRSDDRWLDHTAPPPDTAGSRRGRESEREDRDGQERGCAPVGPEGDVAAGDGDRAARVDQRDAVQWGVYEPAIRRWERVLGRGAPAPTDDRGRLSPEFVEWMLGFPDGWTDGVTRTARLKMLGNAVQVQCAELVGLAAAHWLKESAA